VACIKEEVSFFSEEGEGQKLLAVILAATCVHLPLTLGSSFVCLSPCFLLSSLSQLSPKFPPLACRKLRARRPDTNTLRDNVMNFGVGRGKKPRKSGKNKEKLGELSGGVGVGHQVCGK